MQVPAQKKSHWKRITSLNDGRQFAWFQASQKVYESVFSVGIQEPWINFKDYILDTEQRRDPKTGAVDPEHFYYVAVVDDIVHGMVDFDIYRSEKIGFVCYLGVNRVVDDHQLHPQTATKMVREIGHEINAQMNRAKCEGFLFEIETVLPENLIGRHKARHGITPQEKNILNRIKLTGVLQRLGALKLMWVTYYQPKLVWDWNLPELRLHLMFVPSAYRPLPEGQRLTLSRNTINRYVRFVYLTEYLEGFETTEKGPDWEIALNRWKNYLEELYRSAVEKVPPSVTLRPICLEAIKPPVFISYPDKDRKLAELTQEYLESLGFPIFFWGKNSRQSVGKRVWREIYKWIDESSFILIIVTPTRLPKGQLKEIKYMLKHNYFKREKEKRILTLIIGARGRPRTIPDSVIYFKCGSENFCQGLEEVAENLIQYK